MSYSGVFGAAKVFAIVVVVGVLVMELAGFVLLPGLYHTPQRQQSPTSPSLPPVLAPVPVASTVVAFPKTFTNTFATAEMQPPFLESLLKTGQTTATERGTLGTGADEWIVNVPGLASQHASNQRGGFRMILPKSKTGSFRADGDEARARIFADASRFCARTVGCPEHGSNSLTSPPPVLGHCSC
jgi:hypothetical protein